VTSRQSTGLGGRTGELGRVSPFDILNEARGKKSCRNSQGRTMCFLVVGFPLRGPVLNCSAKAREIQHRPNSIVVFETFQLVEEFLALRPDR
jgi:hypothetical protein